MMVNLYPVDAVKVEGETYTHKTKPDTISLRKTCVKCKCPVVNDHASAMHMIDVPGGVLNVPFEPTMHLRYAERIMSFNDGVPKFKDLPAVFAGSDERVTEEASSTPIVTEAPTLPQLPPPGHS